MDPVSTVNFMALEDRTLLGEVLADHVASMLDSGDAIAVTGGTTPPPFLAALKPMVEGMKLIVTLSDERWVPESHPDSNAFLLRQHLLTPDMEFVSLYSDAPIEQGQKVVEARLAKLPLPFAAVVLGMGEDGHVASLFPGHPALMAGLDPRNPRRCIAIDDAPKPPSERMSLTYNCLLDTMALFIHITGQAKRDTFERAMKPGPVEEYPVRAFLRQTSLPVSVFWSP